MLRPFFSLNVNDDQQGVDVAIRGWFLYLVQLSAIFLLALTMIIGRIDLARFGLNGAASQMELASVSLLIALGLIVFLWAKDACRRSINTSVLVLATGLVLLAGLLGVIDCIANRPIAWGRVWDVCRIAIALVCLNAILVTRSDILALTLFVIGWVLLVSTASYVVWEYYRVIIISGISWTRILVVALAFATAYLYKRPNVSWFLIIAVLAFFLFSTSMKSALIGILMVLLVALVFSATVNRLKPVLLLLCAIGAANLVSYFTGDVANITNRVQFSAGAAGNPTIVAAREMLSTSALPKELLELCENQDGNNQYCLSPYITDTTERLRLWAHGVQLLRENPVTGVGVDGYEQVLVYYSSASAIGYTYSHPHNVFLDVGTLHGLFALLFFMGLLLTGLVILLRTLTLSPLAVGYFSGAIAILTMALFGGDIYDARYVFIFPALAALASTSRA